MVDDFHPPLPPEYACEPELTDYFYAGSSSFLNGAKVSQGYWLTSSVPKRNAWRAGWRAQKKFQKTGGAP